MATASDTPADTTMMRIVHDALRRDLARANAVLNEPESAGRHQRRAIGAHLTWMMRFLHAHHASEDDGLYPLVRERAGAAADVRAVLDRMSRGHEAVATALAQVETAAAALVADGSDDAARRTLVALDALGGVLPPHLREEEADAMPIVTRLISAAEWQAIEQAHNLDSKSMFELGFEGHWLIDSCSDADRATVIGLVPPIPRFLLLHGYARRYRRHAAACWGRNQEPPRRVQLENRVEVRVEADIDEVWELVRDVTRVGEWSHECVGAAWLGDSTAPVPGARFRGRNRAGVFRWGRVCEIVSADPYELVWITVPTALYPDSSEWRISLEEVDAGTRISQEFRVVRAPKVLAVLYALVIPAHRDRTAALVEDLTRLGALASRIRTTA
jgi:hemerythrin-like domain-containing protein